MRRPGRPRLLISDFAGHAFTYELAKSLDADGLATHYSYCSSALSPKGRVHEAGGSVHPISIGRPFEKYRLLRRTIDELHYGIQAAITTWRIKPERHLVCNMPLLSLAVIMVATAPRRSRVVLWFQDVQSGLAGGLLEDRRISKVVSALETVVLRCSRRVIAISPHLVREAERRGVDSDRIALLENWAPIEEIPVVPSENAWSRANQVDDGINFFYTGTLARKHDPQRLVDLARAVQQVGAKVVVVSEGEGADWLNERIRTDPSLSAIRVLPYQTFDELPFVLGTADVLVVLLEHLAGPFSIPSKSLTYLCAGRPILGSIPLSNPAADLISRRARAGYVVDPSDTIEFCRRAIELTTDESLRHRFARSGRRFAEEHFSRSAVIERFREALGDL